MGFVQLRRIAPLALVALVGILAYSNTFKAPFVFDDQSSITNNPVIRDLAGFFTEAGYQYNPRRYVGYLSLALNYRLGGLEVASYHIFNLAVHLVTACLVYSLSLLTFRTPVMKESRLAPQAGTIALLAGLLFVAHPVQTQAVTYVIQRLASLATMFYLASLVLYILARLDQEETGRKGYSPKAVTLYALSLIAALLAMKTKEIAFTLPIVVALYEVFFFKGAIGKRLAILAPFLLTIAVVPLAMLHAGKPVGVLLSDVSEQLKATNAISRGDYLVTQFSVMATYVRLLFLPINQNLDYDYPVYSLLFHPRVFSSLLLLLGLIAVAVVLFLKSRRGGDGGLRLVAFGIFWFFITLAVESSIIPIADVIFEHRLYLPSVGVVMAVAAAAAYIAGRYPCKAHKPAWIVVVFLLAAATWKRNLVWGSNESLWRDVVNKSPGKYRPHNNLGNVLNRQGKTTKAIKEYETALQIKPDLAETHHNMAAALERQGLIDEAIKQYRLALALKPELPDIHNSLGLACRRKGDFAEAIEEFQNVLRSDSNNIEARHNLGVAYGMMGELDRAIRELQAVIRLQPAHAEAHYNLGIAYGKQGMLEQAAEEYRTTVSLAPRHANAHNNLGNAYLKMGLVDKAIAELETAVRLKPEKGDFRGNLARAWEAKARSGRIKS